MLVNHCEQQLLTVTVGAQVEYIGNVSSGWLSHYIWNLFLSDS